MSGLSTVLAAVVGQVQAAVYPQGLTLPSVAGCNVRIYPGWPLPDQLDQDMAAGYAHVSVWPTPTSVNVRTYSLGMHDSGAVNASNLAATVLGTDVTMSGALTNVAALILIVDGADYSHQVASNDTLATVAQALASAVGGAASAAGPVLSIPGAHSIVLRATVTGTLTRELRRQERVLQITVWAPTPDIRSALAAPIDVGLSSAPRLALSDGAVAVMRYRSETEHDEAQKTTIYRRDFLYSAEYPTTDSMPAFTISRPLVNVSV